jgi:hypothetical protein
MWRSGASPTVPNSAIDQKCIEPRPRELADRSCDSHQQVAYELLTARLTHWHSRRLSDVAFRDP